MVLKNILTKIDIKKLENAINNYKIFWWFFKLILV